MFFRPTGHAAIVFTHVVSCQLHYQLPKVHARVDPSKMARACRRCGKCSTSCTEESFLT